MLLYFKASTLLKKEVEFKENVNRYRVMILWGGIMLKTGFSASHQATLRRCSVLPPDEFGLSADAVSMASMRASFSVHNRFSQV